MVSSVHLSCHRHQRFYSLLDRFRATVADTNSPSPPVTSHPLDGDPPPAPELVIADKVGNQRVFCVCVLIWFTEVLLLEMSHYVNTVFLIKKILNLISLLQEWYVTLVKSQCCLRGDVSLLETTELLTKLPPTDLLNIMRSKVIVITNWHQRRAWFRTFSVLWLLCLLLQWADISLKEQQ